MKKSLTISKSDRKRYVLKEITDEEILTKCKILETTNLEKKDKSLVKLIKTQLENDWRTPLLAELERLLKKYFKTR